MFDAFDKLEKKWMIDDTVSRSSQDNDKIRASCVESNFLKPASKEFIHAMRKENVYHDYF